MEGGTTIRAFHPSDKRFGHSPPKVRPCPCVTDEGTRGIEISLKPCIFKRQFARISSDSIPYDIRLYPHPIHDVFQRQTFHIFSCTHPFQRQRFHHIVRVKPKAQGEHLNTPPAQTPPAPVPSPTRSAHSPSILYSHSSSSTSPPHSFSPPFPSQYSAASL